MVCDNEAQDGVTEQLKPLVGGEAAPFGTIGAVREGLAEQVGAEGVVRKRLVQPLACGREARCRIAQAPPTFPLT